MMLIVHFGRVSGAPTTADNIWCERAPDFYDEVTFRQDEVTCGNCIMAVREHQCAQEVIRHAQQAQRGPVAATTEGSARAAAMVYDRLKKATNHALFGTSGSGRGTTVKGK